MELTQYNIVLVNLDPTKSSEIKKTRPCLIISPDEMNRHLRTVVVAPMTIATKKNPTRVAVVHNKRKGAVAIDQVSTIDQSRVIKVLGTISPKEVKKCKSVIRETYVD